MYTDYWHHPHPTATSTAFLSASAGKTDADTGLAPWTTLPTSIRAPSLIVVTISSLSQADIKATIREYEDDEETETDGEEGD
ncbi:hypothetical protein K438DRAFT_1925012 [Mycena galopus ATCC 62051]|nr:hypothetical protein K438DRAFT_1925012 [Mycena galopus ATCC 62051]